MDWLRDEGDDEAGEYAGKLARGGPIYGWRWPRHGKSRWKIVSNPRRLDPSRHALAAHGRHPEGGKMLSADHSGA
jgi:hypothetical protein